MLNQLKLQRDIAVLESFNMGSIREMAYKLLPGIVGEFKDFMTRFNANQPGIQLSGKQKDFLKEIQKHSYFDLAPLYVYVPEGLNASYSDYLKGLSGSALYVSDLLSLLNEFSGFISRILSNPDELKSTDSSKAYFKGIQHDLDNHNAEVSKYFKKNNHDTETKYSSVVQNNSEWTKVFDLLNKTVTSVESVNRTQMLKQVETISNLLDMLQAKIKRKEIDNISHEMVGKLGEYTYIVASQLEFYSVTHYRVSAFAEAVNKTTEKVLEICNRK